MITTTSRPLKHLRFLQALNDEQKSLIADMMQAGAEPKTIIAALRQRYPGIAVISQDVYNIVKLIMTRELAGRSPIEALLDQLNTEDVLHAYQYDDHRRITHLFFAPSSSIKLAREYHHIVLIDATYKTNR